MTETRSGAVSWQTEYQELRAGGRVYRAGSPKGRQHGELTLLRDRPSIRKSGPGSGVTGLGARKAGRPARRLGLESERAPVISRLGYACVSCARSHFDRQESLTVRPDPTCNAGIARRTPDPTSRGRNRGRSTRSHIETGIVQTAPDPTSIRNIKKK